MSADTSTGEIALEPLTPTDELDAERLETFVTRNLKVFTEVGEALFEIRDRRLYRDRFGSFETYCQELWGMSSSYANRLVVGAEVNAALAPIGITVEKESHTRELAGLVDDPEKLREAATKAHERTDGKPKAKDYAEAAAEVQPVPKKANPMKERVEDLRENDPEIRAAHLTGELSGGLVDLLNRLRKLDPEEVAAAVTGRDAGRINRLMTEAAAWFTSYTEAGAEVRTLRSVK